MKKILRFTSITVVVFSLLSGSLPAEVIQLDLQKVLRLAGSNNTQVNLESERVIQAKQDRNIAWYNWLPDVRIGAQYAEQEGLLQNTNGTVERVDRESTSRGLGFSGTGSGLESNPGLSLELDLAEAYYGPRIASQKLHAAKQAEAETQAQVLLKAADLFYNLVVAQRMTELAESNQANATDLAEVTRAFAEGGQGLLADSEQASVYSMLLQSNLEKARFQLEAAEAEILRFLVLDGSTQLQVADSAIIPLQFYDQMPAYHQLVEAALSRRPELKRAEALMEAAQEELSMRKWGPFIPKVAASYSDGEFEGNPYAMEPVSGNRKSQSVAVFWEFKGLGLGSYSNSLKQQSSYRQASAIEAQVRADVSNEIKVAIQAIQHSGKQLELMTAAVDRARNAYTLTRDLVYQNQGKPLDAMQAMRMLEDTERMMLQAAKSHNMAQLRLLTVSGSNLSQQPILTR